MKTELILILILLTIPIPGASGQGQGNMGNLGPEIQQFDVYTDIGIVLNATIHEYNEGDDVDYARVEIYENESESSPVVCWFETPSNLTLKVGGKNRQYAYLFKRLNSTEAQPIETGWHLYVLNVTDDNGLWNQTNTTHYLSGEPHFVNPPAHGTSYIHRDNDGPILSDIVMFWVYVIDYNTPPENIIVKFNYSEDNKATWQNKTMIYQEAYEYWNTTLGPYATTTKVYYYVTANDNLTVGSITSINRTPEYPNYDDLTWRIGVPSAQETITLYRGWNLISINLDTNDTAQTLLANNYITTVIRYLPNNKTWGIAVTGGVADFDLDYEFGYFIYASRTVNIVLSGNAVTGQALTMYKKWNLYGVKSTRTALSITQSGPIDTITARSYYGKYTSFVENYTISFNLVKEYGYWFHSGDQLAWYP